MEGFSPTSVNDKEVSKKKGGTKKRKRETQKAKKNKVAKREYEDEVRPQHNNLVFVPFVKIYYKPNFSRLQEGQRLEKENTAPQIQLLEQGMACLNHKGYRTARCYISCSQPGVYFFEVTLPTNFQGHVRVGWSTEKGDLQAPAGYDKYGFCYRDIEGSVFHKARGKPYGEAYGAGDTIGCLIYLTEQEITRKELYKKYPELQKKKKKKKPVSKAKELEEKQDLEDIILEGSEVVYYKNGVCQGVAFRHVLKGNYYSAISLYMGAMAFVNFGTNLKYPVNEYNGHSVTFMSDLDTLAAPLMINEKAATTEIEDQTPVEDKEQDEPL